MNFEWPAEYQEYQKRVIAFAHEELNTVDQKSDLSFPAELWKRCADFGILAMANTDTYGGPFEAVQFARAMLAMEGLGYGYLDNSLPFGLNAQMWTVQTPILEFGSTAQKDKYLVGLAKGELIGCHSLSEPNAGSDAFSLQLEAKKVDGGYLLNGSKHLISLAPVCDFSLVFAATDLSRGKWGISAFLVDRACKGLQVGNQQEKMGLKRIPIGNLIFNDCFVSEDQMLGSEGLGFSILNHSLEYDRCCILASQLGAMDRQLETNIEYVKSRRQFDQAIGKFQAVSHRVANMKLRIETSRLLLYRTIWKKEQGQNTLLDSALLKLHLSESFLHSSLDSIRNHGGVGYLQETGIEKDVRDAIGGVLYAGTSDIQRNIIAQLLGL